MVRGFAPYVLQLSRILYKSALFYAKQSQFLKKSNGCKLNYNKGLWEKKRTGHLVKTNPNKANLYFTAENAEYAEKKNICVSDCPIKKYALYPISPRSLRTRRLMKNKANLNFTAEHAEYAEEKNICVSVCSIEKYALCPISPRSLRTRRLMKNKANQSQFVLRPKWM